MDMSLKSFLCSATLVAICLFTIPAGAANVMDLRLDEVSGAFIFSDASGSSNNGSCSGATCPQSGVQGKMNNAVQLDGVGDFIQVAGNTSLRPPSTVAVSAHIKTASAPSEADVVSMGDNYTLRIKADGNVRFSYHAGSLNWTVLETTGKNVLDNTYHHLVGQKTTSAIEIYIDGTLSATSSAPGSIVYTLGPNLMIGKHGNGGTRYFNGVIDEVKIYSHALTAPEIAALASILRADLNTNIPITAILPPAKGQKVTEPDFNVQILRVTDGNDGSECHTGYSYWPSFNMNSTRILFACGNTVYRQDFDPNTQTLVGSKVSVVTNPADTNLTDDVLWSALTPDYVVYHRGQTLYWKNVVTGVFGTERAFTPTELGGSDRVLWQMSRSEDNDVWAFTLALSGSPSQNTSHVAYLVWRRSTNTILLKQEFTQPNGWDEVHIDKTGQYLYVHKGAFSSGAVGGWVRDLQAVPITTTTVSYTLEQRAPGHYAMGQGKLVGTDDWQNGALRRSLSSPQTFEQPSVLTNASLQNKWGRAGHYSMLADNQGWVLIGTYNSSGTTINCSDGTQCNLQNEIFQVATNGSQSVRRITHHHSVAMDSTPANYYNTPRANISEDGRFVAFTSNWPQSPATRRDVYVAIIPPAP